MADQQDYSAGGVDIQTAMVHHVTAFPDRATRPKYILWQGQKVWTTFEISVPRSGKFRLAFLSEARQPSQGFDVKAENGEVVLGDGKAEGTLRTWHERRYEDTVEYHYRSPTRLLKVWNVYHRSWPDGRITEEKWTGNAGFLVEGDPETGLTFRCSHGPAKVPDFEQLVVRMVFKPGVGAPDFP